MAVASGLRLASTMVGGTVLFSIFCCAGSVLVPPQQRGARQRDGAIESADPTARRAAAAMEEAGRVWQAAASGQGMVEEVAADGVQMLQGGLASLEASLRNRTANLHFQDAAALAPEVKEALGKMPPEERAMYFRPVSATLYCVMILTIECLFVFTLFSVSKNAEELAGLPGGSIFTETLCCASRSATYPPMICMLFVACRMYVLATTEGLGEPPFFVKSGMVITTLGMTFQFMVVLLLPLVSEQRSQHGLKLSELAGEPSDVHPMLWAHKYHNIGLRSLIYGIQATAMVLIYVGLAGVVVGIATFPAKTTQASVAVRCTVYLSLLYFALFFVLWVLRTLAEVQAPIPLRLNKAKHAALSASMMMRKVPMFAVIFLAARMRALQLDPPHGLPPIWAQACFIAITGALFCESLAAAYVGATGHEEEHRSYFGAYVFTAAPAAHSVQHMLALVGYMGMGPVTVAIVLMSGADGNIVPLEPTMKAVLYLGALFFAVQFLQTCVFFYEDVRRISVKKWASTVLAAGQGVGMCPLLAVLFLATRMRALQITNQLGAPPHYAQHCMYMCVFATFAQLICVMVLPLFTGQATKVDDDGAPTYDMGSMIEAYIVTVVRYISLICLHGGVIGVCIAVFAMTPETAEGADQDALQLQSRVLKIVAAISLVILLAMILSSAKVVGLAVKIGIESVDEMMLGVQITVGKASLDICRGAVSISNLVVYNPPQKPGALPWSSPYLLKVERVLVDVNTWKLIKSCGKVFEVNEVRLEDVIVCFDKPKFKQDSNVQQVVEYISGPKRGESVSEQSDAATRETMSRMELDNSDKSPEVIVEEVSLCGISASAYVKGVLVQLKLQDIKYDNFNQKFVKRKHAVAGDVIKVIVQTFLKSVLANQDLLQHGMKMVGREVLGRLGLGKTKQEAGNDSDEEEATPAKKATGTSRRQDQMDL